MYFIISAKTTNYRLTKKTAHQIIGGYMHAYRNNFLSFLFLAVNSYVISTLIIDFSTSLPKTGEVNVYLIEVICSTFKFYHVLNSYV